MRDGAYRTLDGGGRVHWNEIVQARNRATLNLPDGGRVVMSPRSIARFSYGPREIQVELAAGRMDMTLNEGRDRTVVVRTPGARIVAQRASYTAIVRPGYFQPSQVRFDTLGVGRTYVYGESGLVDVLGYDPTDGSRRSQGRVGPNERHGTNADGSEYEGAVPDADATAPQESEIPPIQASSPPIPQGDAGTHVGPSDRTPRPNPGSGPDLTMIGLTILGTALGAVAISQYALQQQQQQQQEQQRNCGTPPPPPGISFPSSQWIVEARRWCTCMGYSPGTSMGAGLQCPN